MPFVEAPQPVTDPTKFWQGVDENGNPITKQPNIEDIDFSGSFFGKTVLGETSDVVSSGIMHFVLQVDDGALEPGFLVQGKSFADPDCRIYGIVVEKTTEYEPAYITVAILAKSPISNADTLWTLQCIGGNLPTADAALIGLSATTRTLALGTHTFTTQSGKFFPVGGSVLVSALGDPTKRMWARVVSYSGTTLTIGVGAGGVHGSGSSSAWFIYLVDGVPRGLLMREINGLRVTRSAAEPETAIVVSPGYIRDSTDTVDLILESGAAYQIDEDFGFGNGLQVIQRLAGGITSSGLNVTGSSTSFVSTFQSSRFCAFSDSSSSNLLSQVPGDAIIRYPFFTTPQTSTRVTSVADDTHLTTYSELSATGTGGYSSGGWIDNEPSVWYGISLVRRDSDGATRVYASSFTPSGVPYVPTGCTYFRQLCAVEVSFGVIQRIFHLWYGAGANEDLPTVYSLLPNPEFRVPQGITSYSSISDGDETFTSWNVLSDGSGVVDLDRTTEGAKLTVATANKRFGILSVLSYADSRAIVGDTAPDDDGSDALCSLSFMAKSSAGAKLRAAIVAWSGTADGYASDIVDSWGASGSNPTLKTNWEYATPTTGSFPLTTSLQEIVVESVIIDTFGTPPKNVGVFIWVDDDDLSVNDTVTLTAVNLVPGERALPYRARVTELDAAACGLYKNSEFIDYDNASSGLTATNVQDAIDEIVESTPVGGMTDEQRRNAALDSIYLSKSLGYSRRLLNAFADGYEGTDGINAGASSNYTAAGDGKVSPSVTPATRSYRTNIASASDLTTYSFAGTDIGTAAADRIVVVYVDGTSATAMRTIDSVTIGGVSATEIVTAAENDGNGSPVGLFAAAVASGTAATIEITFSGAMVRCAGEVYAIYGASITPTDTASAVGTDPMSLTLDVAAGGVIIAGAHNNGATPGAFTWTNLTEDHDAAIETNTRYGSASDEFAAGEIARAVSVDVAASVGVTRGVAVSFPPSAGVNNMTLITTAQTADASVDTARALIEVDENESITVNTDLTVELTCNGGTNWTTATLSDVGTGQDGRTVYETAATACTAGTSFAARIKTLNNKNVDLYGTSISVSA